MTKRNLFATLALGLGCVATPLSAQQTATAGARPTNGTSPLITLRGCVVEASGHYMLNHAIVVNPAAEAPIPAATGAPAPAGKSDDHVYELIGGSVKSHVGHQVEVAGKDLPSEKGTGGTREPNDLKQEAHPMTGTITVTAVKMVASTCR